MTTESDLKQIINQHRNDPGLIGSLACRLRVNDEVEQQHRDGSNFQVFWRQRAGAKRCTIFLNDTTDDCIAQVDLHDDGSFRVESHQPVSITIDPRLDVLVLVRFAH